MHIKAAVLERKRKLKIHTLKDTGLPDNSLVIKMKYSAICGSQIAEYLGNRGKDNFLPHLLGHEGTGLIVLPIILLKISMTNNPPTG